MDHHHHQHHVVVRPMTPADAPAARRAQYEGWRDTYVRPEGATAQWVEETWAPRLSPEGLADYAAQVEEIASRPEVVQLVAEADDAVVGTALALAPQDGPQEVSVLYVTAQARGRGVGTALMEAVLGRMDPARPVSLGVASFNEGARRFYRRFGFEDVPGSRTLFADTLPEVTMTRPAGQEARDRGRARGTR